MRKRIRACEGCHRLKMKCDVSTSPDRPCERCSRNNLECVPAAPRLQRDRISELESEVEKLQHVLREQSISTTPSWSPGSSLDDHHHAVLTFLDSRIPMHKQQELLHSFTHQTATAWPIIRLPTGLDSIRAKSPILLLSVLAYSATQKMQDIELEVHDELVQETMRILGDEVIGRGQRSIGLVQALLVASFWNKATRTGQQGSCYQTLQLAVDMAIDIGIAGFSLQPTPAAYFCRHEDPTTLEAQRTWLACFVALETSSMSTRRPNTVPWNARHEECLLALESGGDLSDLFLCQIVRITQLIQEISDHMCLCQLATFVDCNDYGTHSTMDMLAQKVDAWAAQIPPKLASSQTLKVWWHLAMIYLYEPLLHTPANKSSFAAPFIPGRIPVKEFPTPVNVIPPLRTALTAITAHCHAIIETVTDMDPSLILSLPSFCFPPTVLYSLFILVTTFVASNDPANTYGQCLTKVDFRIEQCSLKLRTLVKGMLSVDPTMSCYTTRLFDATSWLEEWHNDYITILRRYEMISAH
ncbi:hypothetical protein CC86DRAFT_368241 [Ophiobolus disseminans]|uniref:Zn(2)-C6 fungal-type domain-containing protein n=1 Tax=Ophiobolus disseminans TaxID=1469910 RepID=A0A6A7A7C9_9PLEO|nr:hypothetical protein CC86DRAFT_368241 [Ophiobolus disseminans]